ncbi:hypothetical protein Nepgr_015046 [Nepenthes gracilis]|uniref:Uncharacterized protein n=1 Tax=Nepenthes gracilis TaxID=150966 RepID=A0AAD3SKD5_NEPGR|nr:hypothetical protein Nepgr_015046 [Nepenthes gracilis]
MRTLPLIGILRRHRRLVPCELGALNTYPIRGNCTSDVVLCNVFSGARYTEDHASIGVICFRIYRRVAGGFPDSAPQNINLELVHGFDLHLVGL